MCICANLFLTCVVSVFLKANGFQAMLLFAKKRLRLSLDSDVGEGGSTACALGLQDRLAHHPGVWDLPQAPMFCSIELRIQVHLRDASQLACGQDITFLHI